MALIKDDTVEYQRANNAPVVVVACSVMQDKWALFIRHPLTIITISYTTRHKTRGEKGLRHVPDAISINKHAFLVKMYSCELGILAHACFSPFRSNFYLHFDQISFINIVFIFVYFRLEF